MAFLDLPEAIEADWHNVTFRNSQELESLNATNYAFCQVRELYLIVYVVYVVSCLQNSVLRVNVFAFTNRFLAV